jgi:heme transport system substrate-binding protein
MVRLGTSPPESRQGVGDPPEYRLAIMRIKRIAWILTLALAALVAGCTGSADGDTTTTSGVLAPNQFESADGVVTDVSDTSRLVVLNGDLTEIVFELGAGDSVVGVDLTTTYPEQAAQLPSVGLGRSLNAEKVIELTPTLVIADTQIGPPAALDQIRAAGIPVAIIRQESTLAGVPRKIDTIASILDVEADGDVLVTTVQADIDKALALAERASSSPQVGYVYVRGPETLLMFGTGMPTHFLIEAAGGIDVFGENGVLFAENLSAETLVTAAPDVLITSSEGFGLIGGIDGFMGLPGVADTPAGRTGSIILYDEAKFLGMGPRVGEALMQLILDLHPELSAP